MTDLHKWMTSQNVTEAELAARVGVSQAQIWRIRNGVNKPRPKTAQKLSEVTGIPAWDFLKPEPSA